MDTDLQRGFRRLRVRNPVASAQGDECTHQTWYASPCLDIWWKTAFSPAHHGQLRCEHSQDVLPSAVMCVRALPWPSQEPLPEPLPPALLTHITLRPRCNAAPQRDHSWPSPYHRSVQWAVLWFSSMSFKTLCADVFIQTSAYCPALPPHKGLCLFGPQK